MICREYINFYHSLNKKVDEFINIRCFINDINFINEASYKTILNFKRDFQTQFYDCINQLSKFYLNGRYVEDIQKLYNKVINHKTRKPFKMNDSFYIHIIKNGYLSLDPMTFIHMKFKVCEGNPV